MDARPQEGLNLLWLQSDGRGGCTLSLLSAEQPDLYQQLTQAGIRLLGHPSLSLETGRAVLDLLCACEEGREPLSCAWKAPCSPGPTGRNASMCSPEPADP